MTTETRDKEAQGYADDLKLADYMLRGLEMPHVLRANLKQLIAAYLHFEVASAEVNRLRKQAGV